MAKHKLVSLKRKRDSTHAESLEEREPFFPHSMFLDNEDIEKLGVGNAKLGDEFPFLSTVRVTSVSESDSEGSGKDRRIELAIIEGELTVPPRPRAERIFGGGRSASS